MVNKLALFGVGLGGLLAVFWSCSSENEPGKAGEKDAGVDASSDKPSWPVPDSSPPKDATHDPWPFLEGGLPRNTPGSAIRKSGSRCPGRGT